MNVYLAASFKNQFLMKMIREYLKDQVPGINITSRWIDQGSEILPLRQRAKLDYEDVDNSNVLVCFFPLSETGGAISEMAYCLGKGKKVLYCVKPEFFPGVDNPGSDPLPVGLLKHYPSYGSLSIKDNGYIIHTVGDLCDTLRWYLTQYTKLK